MTMRYKRMYFIIWILLTVSIAIGFALYALKKNISFFYTPSQANQEKNITNHVFRLGGLVKKGSVEQQPNSLHTVFVITDLNKEITVVYDGILPTLFSAGRGVVAQGKLDNQGIFHAEQILAKHDANYMPPPLRKALAESGKDKS